MFKFRCVQQFAAEGPGELSVNADDILIANTNVASDGWLHVRSLRGGGEGFVPFAYLEFLNMQQQAPRHPPPSRQAFSPSTVPDFSQASSPTPPSEPVFTQPGTMPDTLEQPSVDLTSPGYSSPAGFEQAANPFDNFNSMQYALPENAPYQQQPFIGSSSSNFNFEPQTFQPQQQPQTFQPQQQPQSFQSQQQPQEVLKPTQVQRPLAPSGGSTEKLSISSRSNRHSYALGGATNAKDQYKVTNPAQFQETLELWRERERRFMKGEPERLPQPKTRVYFYWDNLGVRHGPLSESEMRTRFDTRQLSPDTPISLQVEDTSMDRAALQQYFPQIDQAFQKAPQVRIGNDITWAYRDDLGQVQGPFPSKQMREWFQDGFFNAETLVRLGDQGDDEFVQLGLLFPEGEGAFLSAGDQAGAKMKQAEIDMQSARPMAGSIALDGGYDQFGGENMYGNPFDSTPPPALGGNGEYNAYGGSADIWGGQPGQDYGAHGSYRNVGGLDPYANSSIPYQEGSDGGKALFVRALSASEGSPNLPPPAIGAGAVGAPPLAVQKENVDDWGITWEDEPEWTPGPDGGEEADVSNPESQPIKTVAEHDDESGEEKPKVMSFGDIERKYLSSVDALYIFLTRSLPKNLGTVQCKIKRSVVGLHVNYNLYELYLEREDGTLGPQIMMAQKHRKYGVDSYYNLAIGSVNKREYQKVIASLVFNTFGTHFLCHNDVSSHKGKPRDLAGVVYQRNIGKGPRTFQVAIPGLKEGSEIEQVEWPHNGSVKKSKMLQSLVSLDFKDLQPLSNKKPTWSKKYRAWTLNFHGRVTRSSVKNFQLVRPTDDRNVVLQFGRIGTDTFTMDFSWPCSPVAAFAICISSLHSKLAVE